MAAKNLLSPIRRIIYLVGGQAVLGIVVLILLPHEQASLGIAGYSFARIALVFILTILLLASGAALRKSTRSEILHARISRWQEDLNHHRFQRFTVLSFLLGGIFLGLGFFVFWMFADPSRYPLVLRLATVVLPITTLCVFAARLFYKGLDNQATRQFKRDLLKAVLISLAILMMSSMTVYVQLRIKGVEWLHTSAVDDHIYVMEGVAGSPWQYRVLADYLVALTSLIFINLGLANSIVVSLIFWRVLENMLLFWAAYFYYRSLGLKPFAVVLGLAIIGAALPPAFSASNLQINTYFDVMFYLLAGWAVVNKSFRWIIPISAFAALNRETSGLIPFLLIGEFMLVKNNAVKRNEITRVFLISFGIYLAIFFGLRYAYPTKGWLIPFSQQPGVQLFLFNLRRPPTWVQLFLTFGIFPFLAAAAYKRIPRELIIFSAVIIPIWLFVNFFFGVVAETRLFLVPYTLIVIPAILLAVSETGA